MTIKIWAHSFFKFVFVCARYDVVPDAGEIDVQYLDGITHLVEHPTQIAPPGNQEMC